MIHNMVGMVGVALEDLEGGQTLSRQSPVEKRRTDDPVQRKESIRILAFSPRL